MRLTEHEYATMVARGTVREVAPEAPRLPQVASKALEAPPGTPGTAPTPEPEKRFLARIRRLAREQGWSTYHTHNSRRSEEGFPDLVLTDGRAVLFVELKSREGKLTRDQQRWLSLLAHAGAQTHVWRPSDWDAIVDRLTRKGHHADPGQS